MPPLEADADAVWFTATDVKDPLHNYEKDCLLLANNSRRFVLFPIQHRDIWDLYKDIEHSFWTAEDFELDVVEGLDTHVLGPQLQVAQTLRASGVAEMLAAELQAPEARCFLGFQGMLENIHVETLSIALLKSGGDFMSHEEHLRISDAHTLETLLVNCADAERNVFTRRLIVYATVLSYYAASLDAAARLWETSPIRYIQRDASRFANFAALLCRSIIAEPGPDVEQLVHNVVAFCARALYNTPRPTEGWRTLANHTFRSMCRPPLVSDRAVVSSSRFASGPATPLTKVTAEKDFVFSTDDLF